MMTATERERSTSSPRRQPHQVVAAVRPAAERLAEAHGLVIWDISFGRVAGQQTLTIACDRIGGISADDLAVFSEALSREFDRVDPVPGEARYVLEVTSPGAERKLKTPDQFQICIGRVARVSLRDGRTVEGEIAGVTERAVELKEGDATVRALFDDISRAQLVVKF